MIKTLRFVLLNSFKATRSLLIIYISLQTVLSVAFIGNNLIFKSVVDSATATSERMDHIRTYILLFILFQIAVSILQGSLKYIWSLIHARQMIYYSDLLISKIACLDVSNFENAHSVGMINRVYARINQSPFYLRGILDLYAAFINFIFTVAIFVISQPFAAAVIVLTNILPLIVRSRFARSNFRLYMAEDETKRKFGYSAELITDRRSLAEIKTAQAFNYVKERFLDLFTEFTNKQLNIERKYQIWITLVEMLPIIGLSYYFMMISVQLSNSVISIGTFVFLFSNTISFTSALRSLSQNFDFLQQDALPLSEMEDFFNLSPNVIFPEINDKNVNFLSKLKYPSITLKNVTFRYPNADEYVFHDLSLTIPFGQKLAIVGENGVGKSTLIKLLTRVYDVTDGEILINDINIKQIPEKYLYDLFATLFQEFAKFHLSIRENFELIKGHGVGDKDLEDILKFSNAYEFVSKAPNGFDQQLGPEFSSGIDLSGGQWQLIAISRAYAQNTPILILDEPTSAIDAKSENEIFERMNDKLKERTLVYISHRFSSISDAERIVVLDKGKIIEDGTHSELITNKGKYFDLYSTQIRRYKIKEADL